MQLVKLESAQIAGCGALVASSGLMARYGYSKEAAERDLMQAMTDEQSDVRVVLDGERVLGFAWVVQRGAFARSPYLRLILVCRSARGEGVGRRLMTSLEGDHRQPNGLFLLCSADNDDGIRFYQHLGYELVGTIPAYTGPGRDERILFKAPIR